MSAIVEHHPSRSMASSLMPQTFDQAMRLAEVMSRGKLVPQHLQGSVADCFMVIEQAMRWNMSPFAVAQSTSCIKGKLMFEGKLVAAAVETSGAIMGFLDYKYEGAGQDRSVTVVATRRGENAPRNVRVELKDAKTDNGQWIKQPDQQLAYHGARVWARRWTPAVMLGVYSPEEFGRSDDFTGTTIEAGTEPATPNARIVRHDKAPEPIDMQSRRPVSEQVSRAEDIITNGSGPPKGQPRETASAIGDDMPDDLAWRQDEPDVAGLENGARTWIEEFAKAKSEKRLSVLEDGIIPLLEALSQAAMHKLRGDVARAMSDARKRIVPPTDLEALEGVLPPVAGGMGK